MATGEPTGLVAPPPESCPGTGGENAGKASACNGCPNQSVCSTGAAKPVSQDPDIPLITKRLENVKHKVSSPHARRAALRMQPPTPPTRKQP